MCDDEAIDNEGSLVTDEAMDPVNGIAESPYPTFLDDIVWDVELDESLL